VRFTSRRAATRRHRQLLNVADRIVSRHALDRELGLADPAAVTALAFGRHGLRIDDAEARDYLNAVLAERGLPLLPTPAAVQEGDS